MDRMAPTARAGAALKESLIGRLYCVSAFQRIDWQVLSRKRPVVAFDTERNDTARRGDPRLTDESGDVDRETDRRAWGMGSIVIVSSSRRGCSYDRPR
jgi:hypothetical protein